MDIKIPFLGNLVINSFFVLESAEILTDYSTVLCFLL
jgi:hypothetical protein